MFKDIENVINNIKNVKTMKTKEKIAISIDADLLGMIDSHVDGISIRSRSQAIEMLLRQSIKEEPTNTAVLLIHEKDMPSLFKEYNGFPLIQHHLNFLITNKIKKLFVIAKEAEKLKGILEESPKHIEIVMINDTKQEGTASALNLIRGKIDSDFVVINGDTFNDFELRKMIQKHKQSNKTATIGLISSKKPAHFGAVILDGEEIVEFKEKEQDSKSNVINAGIYVLKPTIFSYINDKARSLERDVFSLLASKRQLIGYFTHGDYVHAPEI